MREGDSAQPGGGAQPELSARELLLDAIVEHARGTGIGNQSLRKIGQAVGSSHRMLLYHFGSRQGLADAVAGRTLEDRQRRVEDLRIERRLDRPSARSEVGPGRWGDYVDDLEDQGPLLFELWVQAMVGLPGTEAVRAEASVSSVAVIAETWSASGCSAELSRDLAVLQLAMGRGLMFDLLLGGDRSLLARSAAFFAAAVTNPDRTFPLMESLMPAVGERARAASTTGEAHRSEPPPRAGPGASGADARDQLIEALLDHVARAGFGDQSLRQLAAALGTSHRMLIYHFGSREGLIETVVARIEDRQRAELTSLVETDRAADPNSEPFTDLWNGMLDNLDAYGPLVFQLALPAIRTHDHAPPVRDLLIEAYLRPLQTFWLRVGFEPEAATDAARLHVAIARGLMIDYLLGGSRQSTHRAIGLFGATVSRSLT